MPKHRLRPCNDNEPKGRVVEFEDRTSARGVWTIDAGSEGKIYRATFADLEAHQSRD